MNSNWNGLNLTLVKLMTFRVSVGVVLSWLCFLKGIMITMVIVYKGVNWGNEVFVDVYVQFGR